MADVLRPAKREEPKKLFIVNVAPPNRRLLLAAEQHDPYYFLTIGQEANFENFAEELDQALRYSEPGSGSAAPRRSMPSIEEFDLMTRAEREAFSHCLDLATRIWWSSGAAGEGSELRGSVGPVAILKHAREVFNLAARLASASGLWLSSPEKYLLRCAGLLHDLGFFTSVHREPSRSVELRGIRTAELLEESLHRDGSLRSSLIPVSYEAAVSEELIACLLHLCRLDEAAPPLDDFIGDETGAPIRSKLLTILFVAAERLARDHAFLPVQRAPLDYPEMDIFQRWRQGEVHVEIEPRRMTAHGPEEEKETSWFLLSSRGLIEGFERIALEYGGFGLALDGWPVVGRDPQEALGLALEEALAARIRDVEPGSVGEQTSLLDLIALFSLDTLSSAKITPETSPAVSAALQRINQSFPPEVSEIPLLDSYLNLRRRGAKDRLESLFVKTFEENLYPAWRFLARRWQHNVEAIVTGEFSLEMGSSRFRRETIPGLNHLLREKVDWQGDLANAHEGCTQCTSRLLYSFGRAMLLFPRGRIKDLVRDASGRTIEDAIRGMLLHFLARRPDEISWWGLGGEDQGRIVSPEYLAYAAWVTIFYLEVDNELQAVTGEGWLRNSLGIERSQMERLARERADALLQVTLPEILQADREEPISRTVGMMGRLLLNILAQPHELLGRILPVDAEQKIRMLSSTMKEAESQLPYLNMLSRLYFWPINVLMDKVGVNSSEDVKSRLTETCMACLSSLLWVPQGRAAGSWSYDTQNTYIIAGSLALFWRHALAAENREEFARVFERLGRKEPSLR
jgi:hypothetical protein